MTPFILEMNTGRGRRRNGNQDEELLCALYGPTMSTYNFTSWAEREADGVASFSPFSAP